MFENNCPIFTTISDNFSDIFSDTISDIFRENPLDSNEELVSYDVDSLFTSIHLDETISFILDEIYVRKKLEPFFKKLLNKLCKGFTFLANGRLLIRHKTS